LGRREFRACVERTLHKLAGGDWSNAV